MCLMRLSVLAVVILLINRIAEADPKYSLRLDTDGVPLILAGTGGFSGGLDDAAKLSTITRSDNPMQHVVVVMDKDGSASGFDQFILDPALASPNNAAIDAKLSVFQTYANQELFNGSVAGAIKISKGLTVSGHARDAE